MLWEQQLGEQAGIISSPLLVGNQVAVANEDGEIYLFDVDSGDEIWSVSKGVPVHASLASDGSRIFASTTRGRFMSISSRTGQNNWVHTLPDTTVRFAAPGIDEEAEMVVVGSTDGKVRAFDSTNGDEKWEAALEGAIIIAPLFTKNTIYIGTLRGKVYAIDKHTGEKIWEHKVTGRVKSAMVAHDGKLIVLSETQQLFMFEPEGVEEISP